jgi:PPOX class probable F420-dependent enzyme
MPSILTTEVRAVLESGALAHLVTLNGDGSPQVTCIWVGIEDDEIVSGHLFDQAKLRNVRRDPRVSLSLEAEGRTSIGLREYLVVHGTGRVTEGGAADLLQRLAHVYMGPDAVFPPEPMRDQPGHVLHITPERLGGVGPWA